MSSRLVGSAATRLGQLFFSIMSHRFYDVGLYRFVTPRIWRCATAQLMDNYVENISNNHLEIGVGSGYFLEHTLCPEYLQRLVLLDLNQRCLSKSAKRLKAFEPQMRHHDILMPFAQEEAKVASVGMNYVLHCIPGSFRSNERIFTHIHSLLEDGGVLFGATLLKQPASKGIVSWLFMKLLNTVGIFNNSEQTLLDLEQVLGATFSEVQLSIVGCAVVFRAVK